jgi:hypothetical protein
VVSSHAVAPMRGEAGAAAAALPRTEVCPVCQTGRMLVVETLFPPRAVWTWAYPCARLPRGPWQCRVVGASWRQSRLSVCSGTRLSTEAAAVCTCGGDLWRGAWEIERWPLVRTDKDRSSLCQPRPRGANHPSGPNKPHNPAVSFNPFYPECSVRITASRAEMLPEHSG